MAKVFKVSKFPRFLKIQHAVRNSGLLEKGYCTFLLMVVLYFYRLRNICLFYSEMSENNISLKNILISFRKNTIILNYLSVNIFIKHVVNISRKFSIELYLNTFTLRPCAASFHLTVNRKQRIFRNCLHVCLRQINKVVF